MNRVRYARIFAKFPGNVGFHEASSDPRQNIGDATSRFFTSAEGAWFGQLEWFRQDETLSYSLVILENAVESSSSRPGGVVGFECHLDPTFVPHPILFSRLVRDEFLNQAQSNRAFPFEFDGVRVFPNATVNFDKEKAIAFSEWLEQVCQFAVAQTSNDCNYVLVPAPVEIFSKRSRADLTSIAATDENFDAAIDCFLNNLAIRVVVRAANSGVVPHRHGSGAINRGKTLGGPKPNTDPPRTIPATVYDSWRRSLATAVIGVIVGAALGFSLGNRDKSNNLAVTDSGPKPQAESDFAGNIAKVRDEAIAGVKRIEAAQDAALKKIKEAQDNPTATKPKLAASKR